TALKAACATGRAGLGLPPGGVLAPGMPADVLLLDLDLLDPDALMPVDPRDFVMTRATRNMIRRIYAGERLVLSDGRPTGVDIDRLHTDLRTQVRAGLPGTAALAALWPEIEDAIAAEYRGCC
ncbi:MAG: amidohydrolase, partial [Alphaproteobacteria bacterium]|nr:amidohydrolase [Alphaproteobacteria bacterium]